MVRRGKFGAVLGFAAGQCMRLLSRTDEGGSEAKKKQHFTSIMRFFSSLPLKTGNQMEISVDTNIISIIYFLL